MKLFGKTLFERSTSICLYDFAQHGLLSMASGHGNEYIDLPELAVSQTSKKNPAKEKVDNVPKPTPKELYALGTLTIPAMWINVDPDYIAEQQGILNSKLELLPKPPRRSKSDRLLFVVTEPGGVSYGRQEIESMRDRLGYRTQIEQHKLIVNEFPHTTTDKIRELLASQSHLEAKLAYNTLPDLPSEAVDAMKAYTGMTKQVTGKLPVFYLIAEKKDDKEVQRRRDPILLAQSPFGFFWQVLGAWDEEVKFLEEL